MTNPEKIAIELPVLLPNVPDHQDSCVQRLIALLQAKPGIDKVHVKLESGEALLCIHYDPEQQSLQRVRELAESVGATVTQRFGHSLMEAEPMHARVARRLSDELRGIPGVVEAEVAPSGTARIEFDRDVVSEDALSSRLGRLGFSPISPSVSSSAGHASPAKGDHDHDHDHEHGKSEEKDHNHSHGGLFGANSELIFSLLCGALVLLGWLLQRQQVINETTATGIFIVAYLFGGYYTLQEALKNLKIRRFEIDTLMLVAAAGAAALGEWAEGALLLFLFSLGHSLEHYAMGRAKRAIEALAKLAPETALVIKGDQIVEVSVTELNPGDLLQVKPNERLPADGIVVSGFSSINQAPVTGESVPVDKQPVQNPQTALAMYDKLETQHRVFAGTINGSGALTVMVARRASESTMARVVRMVTEAQTQRSPTQNFTEKFERVFVPAVLVLVVILLGAGLVIDEPFSASFYRAMAVLVAASPCALAISVPSAVLSGVARAARSGVLIKGGAPLENLGTLTAIAFDKTGTLTEGKPRLIDAFPTKSATETELLAVALAVEKHSDHPIASAIVEGASTRLGAEHQPLEVLEVTSITGRGIQAQIGGEAVHIGKATLFDVVDGAPLSDEVREINNMLIGTGRTTMIVRKGARYLGVLGVMDTPRPAAPAVMRELQSLGIKRLIMISGDNQQVADAVAKSVGLTEAQGDLMPDDKVKAIQTLRGTAGKVAMVGDGVNDAPAMANATVGIAMGAAGSDVALEAADVALMADDLRQLPLAVGLSRSTSRVIRQNLWVSLGVVAVLIPATILGLNIGTAVLFHEGSTLIVVANALRLLAFKGRSQESEASVG